MALARELIHMGDTAQESKRTVESKFHSHAGGSHAFDALFTVNGSMLT